MFLFISKIKVSEEAHRNGEQKSVFFSKNYNRKYNHDDHFPTNFSPTLIFIKNSYLYCEVKYLFCMVSVGWHYSCQDKYNDNWSTINHLLDTIRPRMGHLSPKQFTQVLRPWSTNDWLNRGELFYVKIIQLRVWSCRCLLQNSIFNNNMLNSVILIPDVLWKSKNIFFWCKTCNKLFNNNMPNNDFFNSVFYFFFQAHLLLVNSLTVEYTIFRIW